MRTLDFLHGGMRVTANHGVAMYGRDGQPIAATAELNPDELRMVANTLKRTAAMLESKPTGKHNSK